ncbi:hypothetical protein MSP8887_01667 [Marinomonas spartinae]|uniref:hypothetical protein n=1 Tax=Marinomonas spartinae TaxID=1792290 RepID=UPI0008090231|nr:hypothetical protein [Marinomonas spartinae]SBS32197.1 hypothetical protein MSP8887_01667 [Marinomonas spartinae]
MSDRDYAALFPSWGQFFVFILIFYIGIYSISVTSVSFIHYVSIDYIFAISMLVSVFLFFLSYFMVFGSFKASVILFLSHTLIAIASLIKIFFDKNDEFFWFQISVSVLSAFACFLLRSSYFKEFVDYRKRHIAVVKKARRGEFLDDGEPFYREKIKDS